MAPRVVLITDPRFDARRTEEVIRAAAGALGEGRLLVQLRDKTSDDVSLRESAQGLRRVTREAGARFVVNGNAAIAHDVIADGVHLPSGDRGELASRIAAARGLLGDGAFVSTAAHDDDDVRAAIDAGATAVLVSPIFATPGKGAPRGVGALASARALAGGSDERLLVYALGGVTGANAAQCAAAGADGAAVITHLFEATSVDRAARELAEHFGRASRTPI